MNLTSFTGLGAQQEAAVVDQVCAVTITGVWRVEWPVSVLAGQGPGEIPGWP